MPQDQTILDAALRAGIYLPHACCHGLCATCKVQITDGEVDHGQASPFALMDFERDERKTLACCATLQSDLTIEADIDEEPDAEIIPVRDFSGTVTRIENLTPTIKGLWITLDQPLHFQAGQYINLDIPTLEAVAAAKLLRDHVPDDEVPEGATVSIDVFGCDGLRLRKARAFSSWMLTAVK